MAPDAPRLRAAPALAFLLGALLIHVVLAFGYARTVGRFHDVRRMDARWLSPAALDGSRAVDVMVAGDSHPRFAVAATRLGRAINVSVPGEHYLKTLYRLRWLLANGRRKVGAVLLPYDAASFSSFKHDNFEPELVWGRYVDFWELAARKNAPFRYAGKWGKARLAPYVGELTTVIQFGTRTKHFRRGPETALGLARFEGGVMAARRHLEGHDPWSPDLEWAFREILEGCRSAGVRVVLVRYPVTGIYAKESRRLGAVPELRDALLAEVGEPGVVDHLDYEGLFFGHPELFGDGDHLNSQGRRLFSATLREDLERLGVVPPERLPNEPR